MKIKWDDKVKFAGVDPMTGVISINLEVWKTITPAQRATLLWHELSHQRRILSMSPTMRKIQHFLYEKTSLGKFLEEAWAQKDAMDSLWSGIRYGYNYKGVNKVAVWLEGIGLVGASGSAGWWIGNKVFVSE